MRMWTGAILAMATICGAAAAQASVICEAPGSFGKVRMALRTDRANRIEAVEVTVSDESGAVQLERSFADLQDEWDGHMTGLVTARGLALKYQNHFGCLRNVSLTTNLRSNGLGYISTLDFSNASCTDDGIPICSSRR